jgi:glycosyltransferase involved in cell wall biosynthesis
MENQYLFSITIPAYKGAFLKECIQSVLSQTYYTFEIVIVNDNSPEDLETIVKSFSDERIRYYKNDVGFGAEHVVGNWNKCLAYAKGDFMICMGDDDKLKPNFLSDMNDLIRKYPELDVYYSRTEIINENSEVVKLLAERPERESVYEMIQKRKNGRSMFVGDYCYRTSVLREKGGFYDLPFAWGSDAVTAYMMAGQKGIANTRTVGFQYRVNSHTISSSYTNIEGKMRAIQQERGWFRNFYSIPPADSNLNVLYEDLKNDNERYFERMASGDLIRSISESPIRSTWKWIRQRKYYELSLSFIFHCAFHALLKK